MSTFEVKRRDGLARIGEYHDGTADLSLPAAVDTELLFPGLADHPWSNIPLQAPREFVEEYFEPTEQPVQVHPLADVTADSGACVMVANWHTTLDNPRAYVRWLVGLKESQPPDVAFYAPAAALPSNVALLIYSGFDLFDFRAADLRAAQGIYCTAEGEFPAAGMWDAGLCGCAGCRERDLRAHNRTALLREIALVRHFILVGQLREFMEGRCRVQAAQVAILRLLDEEYPFVERRVPVVRAAVMRANAAESMKRPEVKRFAERVINRYAPPQTEVAVLLPCSAKKPYSLSQSHARFQSAIQHRAHELIITSPLGLVPRELERIYPAAHYDVPVTGYWDREERAFVTDVLTRYFKKNPYRRVIAHLDGDTLEIVRDVADACGFPLECTSVDHPTSGASLAALGEALAGERKVRSDLIAACLSWQFGRTIDTRGMLLKGRVPRQKVLQGRTQLFSLDAETGLFRPTFAGWDLIEEGYRVQIDDFIPQGDVLAPGVVDADPAIREGDEVLVVGPRALATGRAVMGADEMCASKRGVAVRVRKVKKL
jgi:archaeosine synthase